MNKQAFFLEGTFSLALSGLLSYLGVVAVPFLVLVGVLAADYITGMVKAAKLGELSSSIGRKGLIRKACSLLLMVVGMVVDFVLTNGAASLCIDYNIPLCFGLMVCLWLIINELISIIENLSIVGVPMPAFLIKTVKQLKLTLEKSKTASEAANEEKITELEAEGEALPPYTQSQEFGGIENGTEN
ncbi:MAG: phage holin family protein [Oscillospiraceae bacterium]|jgi:toxin secretion/phage lysis holin|nr:phage holin family protein [Oscillospiraceae bacterium]